MRLTVSNLFRILREWDATVRRVAQLDANVKLLRDENRLIVAGMEGLAEELQRLRESLRAEEVQAQENPVKTVRRATRREFETAVKAAKGLNT